MLEYFSVIIIKELIDATVAFAVVGYDDWFGCDNISTYNIFKTTWNFISDELFSVGRWNTQQN